MGLKPQKVKEMFHRTYDLKAKELGSKWIVMLLVLCLHIFLFLSLKVYLFFYNINCQDLFEI